MRFISIRAKLVTIFIVSVLLTSIISATILKYTQTALRLENESRLYFAILTLDKLYSSGVASQINKYLLDIDFKEINDEDFINEIYTSTDKPIDIKTNFGLVSGIVYDNRYFLKINNIKNNTTRVYENIHDSNITSNNVLVLTFCMVGLFISSLMFCYFLIEPLYHLKNHIINLLSNRPSNFVYEKNNEIGILYKEFNKAIKKNNELTVARRFFLRAIMHELKTPIAKGMFAASMPENEKNKEILLNVFKNMNSLINELKNLEEILSSNHDVVLEEKTYSTLLEESLNALYLDDLSVVDVKMHVNKKILVDSSLLVILIKNLLDNALKYSSERKCIIEFFANEIIVRNKGEEQDFDVNEYFKPFIRGKNTANSFGLGLYLIKYICDTQGYKIEYFYTNEYHNFKVTLDTF